MQVKTRFWNFDKGSADSTTMVPLLELANHNEPGDANAYVGRAADKSQVAMTALTNISAGEEVSISYLWNRLHRADHALLEYGFIQQGRRPPLLAAYDYGGAGGEELRQKGWFYDSPPNDDAYLPSGTLATAGELRRLVDTLRSFPTSEAEDWAQLQKEAHLLTWRQQLLLQFRIERKAALSYVSARLADALAAEDTTDLAGDPRWNTTFDGIMTDASPLLRFQSLAAADSKLSAVSEALLARNVTSAAYDLQLPPAPSPDTVYWLKAAALLRGGFNTTGEGTE